MNESSHVDPGHFLKSFLVVTFHYVVLYLGLLMGMLVIARVRFPEIFRLWTLKKDNRDEFWDAWEKTPELLFPTEMCLWLILLAALLAVFIGLQVAFWAPFSKAGHGIFLAILCIVTFLQISITQDQIPKWMLMGMLITCPICIVVASSFGERWFGQVDELQAVDENDSPEP